MNKYTFLDYGIVFNDNYYVAKNEVSKQWNIKYKRVASCMVGDDLIDSVRTHNAMVSAELAKRYGDNWEERYNSQWSKLLDSLDNETKIAERENKFLKTKQIALNPVEEGSIITITAIIRANDGISRHLAGTWKM